MYEFHGWIKLSESPSEMDEGGLDQKVKKLKNELSSFGWSSGRGMV
ncbi:Imm7 family immunity protein [Metapseudomonas otitidis]|nr:Imm7 family immunity protein [Pseudomonas otitidis]